MRATTMGRLAAVAAIGLVGGAVWAGAQAPAHTAAVEEAPSATTVVTERVEAQPRARVERLQGVARLRDRATLSFQVGGRLARRAVDVGDRVEAGAVLAGLDARAYRNAVAAARAGLAEVEAQRGQVVRDQARASRLTRDGVSTAAALERADTGLERVAAMERAAGVQLRESRRQAAEATLRAPFAGVVTAVFAEVGELVQPGQPVVRLAGPGGLEVLVEATPEMATRLAPGDAVTVRAVGVESDDPLADVLAEGRVRSVVADAVGLGGLHPVMVDLPDDGRLRAGLGLEIGLRAEGASVPTVPLEAIVDPSGRRPFAWKVVDGRVERAWLRLGGLLDGRAEVREGLVVGDAIVTQGQARLLEGDAVAEVAR
jgi:RND family efflux transporter MFP subunit